jgi:hypothetical protein
MATSPGYDRSPPSPVPQYHPSTPDSSPPLKVDSFADFKSALRAGNSFNDDPNDKIYVRASSSNDSSCRAAMMKALGGDPLSTAAPVTNLAAIHEDNDDEEGTNNNNPDEELEILLSQLVVIKSTGDDKHTGLDTKLCSKRPEAL